MSNHSICVFASLSRLCFFFVVVVSSSFEESERYFARQRAKTEDRHYSNSISECCQNRTRWKRTQQLRADLYTHYFIKTNTQSRRIIIMGWADVYISSFIVFSSRSLSRGSTKHRFVAEWIVPAHATKRWCNFALQSADCSHLKKKKKKTKTKKKNKNVLGAKARVSLPL